MAINQITLLVHPFYGLEDDPARRISERKAPYYVNWPKYNFNKFGIDAITCATILWQAWETEVARIKQNPNQIAVLFNNVNYKNRVPKIRTPQEQNFTEMVKQILGDRLTQAENPYGDVIDRLNYKYDLDDFAQQILVKGICELSDVCVRNYTEQFVNRLDELFKENECERHIKSKVIEDLCADTFPNIYIKGMLDIFGKLRPIPIQSLSSKPIK